MYSLVSTSFSKYQYKNRYSTSDGLDENLNGLHRVIKDV